MEYLGLFLWIVLILIIIPYHLGDDGIPSSFKEKYIEGWKMIVTLIGILIGASIVVGIAWFMIWSLDKILSK